MERDSFQNQLIICIAIKVCIALLTIIALILLDPIYIVAYISIHYSIVIIYIVSALTLLYCVVSVVLYAILRKREQDSLTNCAISEIILAGAGMIGWMQVCGIAATISQRTIIETGERFGWIGACAGLIVALFLGICGLFCLNLINTKVLSSERQAKYGKYPNRLG